MAVQVVPGVIARVLAAFAAVVLMTTVTVGSPFVASAGAQVSEQVLITEFMASNESTLLDEDGEAEDWLELFNPTGAAIDLAGWTLTDDPADPTQWALPAVTIGAGEYLVVFASDKDRAVVGGELHTNFKLGAGGEYLGLYEPDGTPSFEYAPEYPCLLYTSPSPRDATLSRMPSSA